MTEMTPLDTAHAVMEAEPDNEAARLKFYERLADSEMFLLLTEEAAGENISPEIFELSDANFVLVFDREERLSGFVGRPAPYAALSGRAIVQMLSGQNIGLGVNLDVAPSQILLPPAAVAWLAETVAHAPEDLEARAEELYAPKGLPEALVASLGEKLGSAGGMASNAYLVAVHYEGGGQSHLLGFVDAAEGAEAALAQAVTEALVFSGIEAGFLDVGFFAASDPMAAAMSKVGLRFELPKGEVLMQDTRPAPGSDPAKPPILK